MKKEANESVTGSPPDFASLPDTAEAEERYKNLECRIHAAQERCKFYLYSSMLFLLDFFATSI